MSQMKLAAADYDDMKIHVKLKISALWVATMFCYIYCDYFELYTPGKLAGMLAGKMQPLGPVTQGVLFGSGALMAVPSVMIFLALVLKPQVNRWANILLGIFYTIVMLLVISMTDWMFYRLFGAIEIVLTALIVWHAWTWPKTRA